MTQAAERGVRETGERIERLLDEIAAGGDAPALAMSEDLVRELSALYGEGLRRMLAVIEERATDATEIAEALAADPVVAGLLSLHDLHPEGPRARIERALERVRPYLGSHGGDIELLGLSDGTLRLRLAGTCDGCPSSAATLESVVRGAIFEAAPEVDEIEVESPQVREAAVISLESIGPERRPAASGWSPLAVPDDLHDGEMRVIDAAAGRIALARIHGRLYASAAACPDCAQDFEDTTIGGSTVTCAGCGRAYDLGRAGRCVDNPALQLTPIPLLSDADGTRIAWPAVRP